MFHAEDIDRISCDIMMALTMWVPTVVYSRLRVEATRQTAQSVDDQVASQLARCDALRQSNASVQ